MNVVVTGGGTVAPIDDVRQIANVSTGRFSAAISEACLKRGATVWHVHTPQAQLPFIRNARFDLTTRVREPRARAARAIARRVANGRRQASPGPAPPGDRRRLRGEPRAHPPDATDRRCLSCDGGLRLRARAPRRQARFRRRGDGHPLPAHAEGDSLRPRLGPGGLPGRVQAAVAGRRGRAHPPGRGGLPDSTAPT